MAGFNSLCRETCFVTNPRSMKSGRGYVFQFALSRDLLCDPTPTGTHAPIAWFQFALSRDLLCDVHHARCHRAHRRRFNSLCRETCFVTNQIERE